MKPRKRYIDDAELRGLVNTLIHQMQAVDFKPMAVMGITRGGLTPAVMLSQYYECPMFTLDYSLRDRNNAQELGEVEADLMRRANALGNVLVVDDINDSGATLTAIRGFVAETLNEPPQWRWAVLLEKCTSPFDSDFWGEYVLDDACADWVVFPWEEWWGSRVWSQGKMLKPV